jgi:hypothetical protein
MNIGILRGVDFDKNVYIKNLMKPFDRKMLSRRVI